MILSILWNKRQEPELRNDGINNENKNDIADCLPDYFISNGRFGK
jgi:hypothetical protein